MTDGMGWLSTAEASSRSGYHVEHIRRLIRQGRLEAHRVGWMWFVNPDSLDAYVEDVKRYPQSGPRGEAIRKQGGGEEKQE